MSITGGVKFFDTSQCLGVNGAVGTASNGQSTAQYALDRNPYTYWYTDGSSDAMTETLTVDFGQTVLISRILLLIHNFKGFNIKYDLSGTWTAFTSVKGLDGSLSGITETAFADGSSYYEFDAVTTGQIQISVTTTQVVNAEKFLSQVIVTSEIGTFQGFPIVKGIVLDRNSKVRRTISGKTSVIKGDESAAFQVDFAGYPSAVAYNVDIDLALTLHDRDTPFLVWLCGGRRGTNYFNYTLRGFRLQDVIPMQITKAYQLAYSQNVYVNSLNASMALEESI